MAQLLANSKIGDKQIASEEFVNDKVKTDVPENAKFTDTTYTEITEAEINTGTASTLRTITARRVTFILSKVSTLINNAIGALTKSSVGLGNVDNVKQIPYSEKGANGGVAELDSTGKVLSSQLPSYVDDVLEYATLANFPTTGEAGKIYIAINTNLTYRWTGTAYTEISPSIALGETSATAYRGDRGKIAYDHSQAAHAPANAQKNSDITKAEIEAKLTGAITSHTHDYVPTNSFQSSTFTTNEIPLSNPLGSFRVATASNADTYTLSTTKVIGAWAKILINRATAPTVTGGTLIKGSDFKPSTNMYLYVSFDGTKSEYYFAEI